MPAIKKSSLEWESQFKSISKVADNILGLIDDNAEEMFGDSKADQYERKVDELVEKLAEVLDEYSEYLTTFSDEGYTASARKSKQRDKMANNNRMRKSETGWAIDKLEDALRVADREYKAFMDHEGTDWDENESRLYHKIDESIDQLIADIDDYLEVLGKYSASTKKSRRSRMNKALNKLGGFTKDDEEEPDDEEIEIEIDDDEDSEEDVEVDIESDDEDEDMIERRCNSEKSMRANKRRKMRKEGVNLPEDADDQQEINQKGSGNAGTDLPEDADEQQDINDKGTGNAGSILPENAEDAQDQKQSSRRKNMRKFSVTNGGSPDQTSNIGRYNQTPRMREAIDRHFGIQTSKSFDDIQMLQSRLNALNKSRRNSERNNVSQKLRR